MADRRGLRQPRRPCDQSRWYREQSGFPSARTGL